MTDHGEVVASVMDASRVSAAVSGLALRPIYNCAGGKRRLVPLLMQHLPPGGFHRYIEPFCGGAALYFALAPRQGAILGDLNPEIVELYAALAHDVESVIRSFAAHVERHEQDPRGHYYRMRDLFNDDIADVTIHERAALVLYLNRACFNGLWRVNREGKFNTPVGYESITDPKTGERIKRPKRVAIDADRLRAAAALLARAKLVAGDYRATIAMARAGDLTFVDCPYDQGFTSYTVDGFDIDDQTNLEINVRALARRGVHVMMTHADTPTVRELYRDRLVWHISEIEAPRSIAADGQRRTKARELIVTSYEGRRMCQ